MGALSMGLPLIFLPAGPMLRGNYRGEHLGSGSDAWKFWDERRASTISADEWVDVEAGIARSYGHCMTMGTASTMTAIAEAMGLTLPGASSIPAVDSNHIRMSSAVGRRVVAMVWEDLIPSKILNKAAVSNAVVVAMATGCLSGEADSRGLFVKGYPINAIPLAPWQAPRRGLAYTQRTGGLDEFKL